MTQSCAKRTSCKTLSFNAVAQKYSHNDVNITLFADEKIFAVTTLKNPQNEHIDKTRMWANAQRDGRPAEYRRHPLFNAAKFG